MHRRAVFLLSLGLCATALPAAAQDFTLFHRNVQVHGFASQGYVWTTGNNWLTMTTNKRGSTGFTEMGLNMSTQLTEKIRFGAQVYDRNLGQLGQYHPSLDWLVLDYRFKPWMGFRGGKVKTPLGLFTDTQDLDFLRTFALLPQSVYPLDLRDSNIAHFGGEMYGTIELPHHLNSLAYTGYVGHRHDSIYSGYEYFLQTVHNFTINYGGKQWGGDLRWNTPVKGLMVGASRLTEELKGFGIRLGIPTHEWSSTPPDFTHQLYGEYTWRGLRLDSEFKRYYRHHFVRNGAFDDHLNVKAWYFSGSYRLTRRLSVGSYYSRYTMTSTFFHLSDTSLPNAHIYDKAVTGRVDLTRYWNVKVEGHFMDGYGYGPYPNGFYPQQNPKFASGTNALVLKTSVYF